MKKLLFSVSCFLLFCMVLLFHINGFAQDSVAVNNTYYRSYPEKIIFRLYLERKFAPFTISSNNKEDLNYKTNSKLSLGAGFTYKIVTINLSYGFKFLNKDDGRGDTKGLDLQLHVYPKKWAVDVLGIFLRGYYLDPDAKNGLHLSDYYKRPDLHRNIVGLSLFRVANYNKFSNRAAFNQRDVQERSAGSVLYGGSSYYGIIKADSSFVPTAVASRYPQAGIHKINFFSIGPGLGYAYTLVLSRHFFFSGAAIGLLHFNSTTENSEVSSSTKIKILPGAGYKAALGYNSSTWSVSAAFTGNALYIASNASYKEYFAPSSSINFAIARRFGVIKKK